ncbi:hypothetical protein DCAR_0205905 [Daucus carota subsp. sativus]|uniref:Uncharacterized protein n=1 Tax=Daucus carota subsp. sativus TaxID=79200 RepID=A0A166CW85_DAUCS|nr:hypothetical protein DCAR_0205905 [Daucus carota subsp. sativus]
MANGGANGDRVDHNTRNTALGSRGTDKAAETLLNKGDTRNSQSDNKGTKDQSQIRVHQTPNLQELEKRAIEACKYWFLLEHGMVESFQKGNYSLVPIALARIDYLKDAIEPGLLQEGLKGEEEALWAIHRFLFNEGWWARAENLKVKGATTNHKEDTVLINFLQENAELIHPNTRHLAISGDAEGIRLALNQIHYNSLTEKHHRSGPSKRGSTKPSDLLDITRSFLKGFSQFVEPSVLNDALLGNDKAISLALGQIHFHSLEAGVDNNSKNNISQQGSFKDVLLKQHTHEKKQGDMKTTKAGTNFNTRGQTRSTYGIRTRKAEHTVFFTGFQENSHPKDLWKYFKQAAKIKDIILPWKRDKYGKRYGFLIMENEEAVQIIVKKLNSASTEYGKLYLSRAKDKTTASGPSKTARPGKHSPEPKCTPTTGTHSVQEIISSPKGSNVVMQDAIPQESSKLSHKEARTNAYPQVKDHVQIEQVPIYNQMKERTEPIINPSEEMSNVTKSSIFIRTVKNETIDTVQMIAEGLGAHNTQIRGITGTTFIAYFANKVDYESLDIEFLQIGFVEVRQVKVEDLMPSRKAWVEVRGLPIMGWTENNFRDLIRDCGNVLLFSKIYDAEGFYQHPKFLIETGYLEEINIQRTISLLHKK